jgi:hypothetical protein
MKKPGNTSIWIVETGGEPGTEATLVHPALGWTIGGINVTDKTKSLGRSIVFFSLVGGRSNCPGGIRQPDRRVFRGEIE